MRRTLQQTPWQGMLLLLMLLLLMLLLLLMMLLLMLLMLVMLLVMLLLLMPLVMQQTLQQATAWLQPPDRAATSNRRPFGRWAPRHCRPSLRSRRSPQRRSWGLPRAHTP